MSPDEIAEVEADDAALVADLGARPDNPPPWYMLQGRPGEDITRMFRRAAIDRRALLAHVKEQAAEIERLKAQLPPVELPRDMRPHSRACGIRRHDHGAECSRNCPTCHPSPADV